MNWNDFLAFLNSPILSDAYKVSIIKRYHLGSSDLRVSRRFENWQVGGEICAFIGDDTLAVSSPRGVEWFKPSELVFYAKRDR